MSSNNRAAGSKELLLKLKKLFILGEKLKLVSRHLYFRFFDCVNDVQRVNFVVINKFKMFTTFTV